MSLDFSGSIGAKTVNARLSAGHVTLKHKDTVMFDGPLWLVCFQRVSTRLKTCDVVYISGSQCHVHTIDRAQLDSIQDLVTCPVYNVGADPLPWPARRRHSGLALSARSTRKRSAIRSS